MNIKTKFDLFEVCFTDNGRELVIDSILVNHTGKISYHTTLGVTYEEENLFTAKEVKKLKKDRLTKQKQEIELALQELGE